MSVAAGWQGVAVSFAPYDTDDALLEQARASGRSQVKVYCPAETLVVLGRGSRAEVELDLDSCARDGVKILRRRGGDAQWCWIPAM